MMKKLNLLVVDDEQAILDSLKMFLHKNGYGVSTAENGLVALDMIKRNNYDALITNLNMPGMGGMDLLAEVNRIKPRIITIIHSGYLALDDVKKAAKLGCYAYITKPCVLKQLKIILEKSLTDKQIPGVILLAGGQLCGDMP